MVNRRESNTDISNRLYAIEQRLDQDEEDLRDLLRKVARGEASSEHLEYHYKRTNDDYNQLREDISEVRNTLQNTKKSLSNTNEAAPSSFWINVLSSTLYTVLGALIMKYFF